MSVVAFMFCISASADAPSARANSFDVLRYVSCDAFGVDAVAFAKKASEQKRPVEETINATYPLAPALMIKLSLLASDALKAGYLRSADEASLAKFLAGVCYAGGMTRDDASSATR